MTRSRLSIFRAVWWASNVLLVASFLMLIYAGVWEFSVRRYLDGFSDAIVPNFAPPQERVEAILNWMRAGSARATAENLATLSTRDPQTTLNYEQLLKVCGTATNAFLNLARASDLTVRRLLLLSPDLRAKHVVAEVWIDRRWIVVDPSYRVVMKDSRGRWLTRGDLQDPATFQQATSAIPNYPREYSYERIAHVRLARLPLEGLHLRKLFDAVYPGWEDSLDWSLLLERESFSCLVLAATAFIFLLFLRQALAWYADRLLRIRRFRLHEHAARAGAAFFSTPEIKD